MILKKLAPSFDEPLETLAACHERIEAQLDELEREHATMDRQWASLREKLTGTAKALAAAERAELGGRMAARRATA